MSNIELNILGWILLILAWATSFSWLNLAAMGCFGIGILRFLTGRG